MTVGQWVRKFTWLLDNVEVKDIVRRGTASDGEDVFEAARENIDGMNDPDWFNVEQDSN